MDREEKKAELEEAISPACEETEELTVTEETASAEDVPEELEEVEDEEVEEDEEDNEEEEAVEKFSKKKKARKPLGKGPKIVIAISLVVVLLFGLTAGAAYALGYSFDFHDWKGDELHVKTRYTAPNFLANMSAETVVATLGDKELTNGLLQLYYGRQLWDLVEEYGSYLSYMGLDLTKPLSQQAFPYAEDMTWEQARLEMAIDAWAQQQTLVNMAQEENYQYPEGLQAYLDNLQTYLDSQAVQYSYTDGNAMVKKEMGASANIERYKTYSEIYNKAAEYYVALYESMGPDAQQVEKYFDEHAEELYQQYKVTKETKPLIDVRHILLKPEATVDEETGNTIYTEESKAACLQKAEELLQQWKNGEATEDSFAQLAGEHTEDPGSKSNGGLYESVYQGQMVEAFDAWCFDESRKPGDTGIVETQHGYHIMYFVYGADEWYRAASWNLCSEMCDEMIKTAFERYDLEVYYYKIVLSAIDFN